MMSLTSLITTRPFRILPKDEPFPERVLFLLTSPIFSSNFYFKFALSMFDFSINRKKIFFTDIIVVPPIRLYCVF